MTNEQRAAQVKPGQVIFAAGNLYEVIQVRWNEHFQSFYVDGNRKIKSKGTFSKTALTHMIGPHFEIVE